MYLGIQITKDTITGNDVELIAYATETREELEEISSYMPFVEIRETSENYFFFNCKWVTMTPQVFEEKRTLKLIEINDEYTKRAELPKDGTPQIEVETWDIQKTEAEGWENDNTQQTPFIDTLAKYRGMDRIVLLNKVLEKTTAYRDYVGELTGKRQSYEDAIKIALTIEDLEAINWL